MSAHATDRAAGFTELQARLAAPAAIEQPEQRSHRDPEKRANPVAAPERIEQCDTEEENEDGQAGTHDASWTGTPQHYLADLKPG
jgi:hypothetical protein